jgi:protein gp37
MAHAHRLAHNPNPAVAATYRGLVETSAAERLNWTGTVRTAPARLLEPFGWARHQLVFVNSLSDLFHEAVPDDFVWTTFRMMELCDWHVFQVLTKRDDRLADLAPRLPWPANVWMGVSVGEQAAARRVDRLRAVPARVRFLSCEPLLEPLALDLTDIHWVITGGESGPHARPFDPAGALALRDQCHATGATFFHKQNGGRNKKATGRLLDGREYDEMPEPTWVPVPPAAERKARRERFRAEFGL